MSATAKVIELKGDPKRPESAEHIILFPGGSISVCRTTDDKYWAHITVNHNKPISGAGMMDSKRGEIEFVRIDTPDGVKEIDHQGTDHFAVLISTK